MTLKAYEFQDMPFEKLVENLMPERSWGQSPFIQVMLSLQNLPLRRALDAAGLKMSIVESKVLASRFELEIHLWETNEGLNGQVVYNPDRFDAERVVRMIKHYCRLLDGAARDPDRRLSELPLLSEEEHNQIFVEWNETATEYPSEECLQEIFDQLARSQPDAPAVIAEGGLLSYGELNDRSARLADYLRSEGVAVGSRVAFAWIVLWK